MGLTKILTSLNVPKNQYNDFGGYHYRSCEDILEAVKPVLAERDLDLLITDSIEVHGSRVYVVATAKLIDRSIKDGVVVSESKGYAREPEHKKGMDESQITGAASSYARKYALNALFLLDDVKDPDTTNKGAQKPEDKSKAATERELSSNEVSQKWNGKIYGDFVYIDNQKIKPPADQLGRLKNHEKYKPMA